MNIQQFLRYLDMPLPVKAFDTVDSTNLIAKAWAREGFPGPAAVFADRQSAGRGRRGRSFFSPAGGLYMSLVVDSPGLHPGQLTTLAAVAVARAVQATTGLELAIKWVNDLLLKGKKVCGILTEGVLIDKQLKKTVIGIGINTGPARFPGELEQIAGTLYTADRPLDKEQMAAHIIREILSGIPRIPEHMDSYRRLCLTLGQQVRFEQSGQAHEGLAVDVDEEGALLVRAGDGIMKVFAGEVSLLKDQNH